ncbi:hypothetical protein OEZ86_003208, partial [Tetradesmus obliquus]
LSATAKNIIYHHGWPSSAAEGAIWSEAAAAHGICLIAVDRPGIGGSTYNPKGTFASYADDVSELLHQLNLQQAVHVGTSGGGPYACACAANNPTTTAGLGLVASMTHCSGSGSKQLLHGMHWFDRFGYNMIANAPQLGSRGLFHEMRLTTQPWAIDLSQITAPALVIQGYADVNVTVPQAKWLAGQLKNVKLQLFPGETHFSLVARHAHGILGMIKAECM